MQFLNLEEIPQSVKIIFYLLGGGGFAQFVRVLVDRSEIKIGGNRAFQDSLMQDNIALRATLKEAYEINERLVSRDNEEAIAWRDKYYESLSEKISAEANRRVLEGRIAYLERFNASLMTRLEVDEFAAGFDNPSDTDDSIGD